jgi:fumigallin biosynthesis monooxygenase-like protein
MNTINRRVAAQIEGDFVVFLIGARVNRWWKFPVHLWFAASMPKMIAELEAHPESGFLGHETLGFGIMVQYWRSLEQLIAYARARDQVHFPYWVKFNKRIGSNGDIGIWHETYRVHAGEYEAVYNNMPPYGLGKIGKIVDAIGAQATATGRLGKSDGGDAPITPAGDTPVNGAV